MKLLFILLTMIAFSVEAQDIAQKIIPVSVWPRAFYFGDKQIVNASVKTCVRAGYRMLTPKPVTPAGKRIKTEKIIQDDKDSSKCKYDIMYEDIPEPVPVPPEVLTNIANDRVSFSFTTGGVYRGVVWLDAPVTNIVVGE